MPIIWTAGGQPIARPPANRDSQRLRAYRAEDSLPEVKERLTHEEGERFLAGVLARAYVRRHYGAFPVHLRRRRGYGAVATIDGAVECSDAARSRLILLHELAHVLGDREERRERARLPLGELGKTPFRQAHGWRWAAIYLDLVRHVLGAEVHDRLRAAMKARRVRYTAPRQGRPLTPEERAQAVERLATYRAAKAQGRGA